MKYNQPLLIGLAMAAALAVGNPAVGEPLRLDPIMLAQAGTPSRDATREAYIRQNEGKFEEWGKKIDAFASKTADRSSDATETAKRELEKAWTDTKVGWMRLKEASKDGWGDSKAAFETSWQKLQRAWDDAQKS